MRILNVSDTHSKHHLLQDLPAADVIVHSGDYRKHGYLDKGLIPTLKSYATNIEVLITEHRSPALYVSKPFSTFSRR